MNAVIYNGLGQIEKMISGNLPTIELNATGFSYLVVDDDVELGDHYVENNALVEMPVRPSPTYQFDYTTKQWAADIADLRAAKWGEIKAARSAAEYGTFMWGAVELDCDEESRARITGGAVLALLDPAFTTNWTAADNTVWSITATQMMQIGGDLGLHTDALHATASALRSQIDAATTEAELAAIVWP